ncbi:hypothetical protein EYZ11_006858 [Aspergillus tanneri]|uniref:Uncharacterized protein n=1 Tax=Aspergillus tanneri TaxID=1220188 RepID=A0A4S3JED1_9EURO|nr:hypothetical protein EYZ11_006858 [Aspergillus tanneri]
MSSNGTVNKSIVQNDSMLRSNFLNNVLESNQYCTLERLSSPMRTDGTWLAAGSFGNLGEGKVIA